MLKVSAKIQLLILLKINFMNIYYSIIYSPSYRTSVAGLVYRPGGIIQDEKFVSQINCGILKVSCRVFPAC